MFKTIPNPAIVLTRFEPPILKKGNVFPAKGIRPSKEAMFIKASKVIQIVNPAASRDPKPSGA